MLEKCWDNLKYRLSSEKTKEKMRYEALVQGLREVGYVRTKKNDGWIKYNV